MEHIYVNKYYYFKFINLKQMTIYFKFINLKQMTIYFKFIKNNIMNEFKNIYLKIYKNKQNYEY